LGEEWEVLAWWDVVGFEQVTTGNEMWDVEAAQAIVGQ